MTPLYWNAGPRRGVRDVEDIEGLHTRVHGFVRPPRLADCAGRHAEHTAPVREAIAERAPGVDFVEIGYHSGYPLFTSTGRASVTQTGGRRE